MELHLQYWAGRRVLVAGGAGFIGSHLVEGLVAAGARVRVADNLERSDRKNLENVAGDVEFLELDLRDRSSGGVAVDGQEAIFNLAAKVGGIEFNRTHQAEMLSGCVLPAINVMDAAVTAGVERYLAVSSACVYPVDAPVPTSEKFGLVGEPEATNLGYGLAKRAAEYHARFVAAETGMKVAVVRPYNAYGPRDHFDPKTSHVIAALIGRCAAGEDPMTVWGTGKATRAFIYVTDLARAMMYALERKTDAEPVNLGSDVEISIKDLAASVLKASGSTSKLVFNTSKPDGYPRRAADVTLMTRIMPELFPLTSVDDGLRQTVEWFKVSGRV